MSTNQKLVEENKKSFLKIAKGNETVEQEKQRLKLSTFSLSSQMSILEKVVKLANRNDHPKLLGHASSIIEQLHDDLLKYRIVYTLLVYLICLYGVYRLALDKNYKLIWPIS